MACRWSSPELTAKEYAPLGVEETREAVDAPEP
jgi:hypothetical protein